MKIKGLKVIFYVSILSLFLMSITILFMPLASEQAQMDNPSYLYVVGGTFWATLFISYLLLLCMIQKRKKLCKKLYTTKQKETVKRPKEKGLPKFMFRNRIAVIVDILLLGSSIGFVACMLGTEGYAAYILLSCVVFFFHMHFLWNGQTYEVIVNYSNNRGGK